MKHRFYVPEKKFFGACCATLAGLAVVWHCPSPSVAVTFITTAVPLWATLLVTQHLGERREKDKP